MTRTEVGLKCRKCAAPVGVPASAGRSSSRRSLILVGVLVLVGVLALVAVLVFGSSSSSDDAQPALPTAVGTWGTEPGLTSIRGSAAAVVLEDGTVLVSGGGVSALAVNAAEVFDPDTGEWREVGPMGEARRGHQAAVLDDGRVLVAGGLADGVPLASAEIYDAADESWSPVAPMAFARLGHSLTVLNDGRVLVAGGSTGNAEGAATGSQTIRADVSAELFDPATQTWSAAGSLASPRFEHTATRLSDGRVVVVGGLGPVGEDGATGPLATTEIYDPATDAFVRSTDLAEGRANHAAVLLGDNGVLVSGGVGGDAGDLSLATAEIFDARAGSWTTTSPMGGARTGHTATLLEDGRVLVAGGESVQRGTRSSLTSAEVFDFARGATGRWGPAGDMACPRSEQAAAPLADGTVLVIAGDAAFPGQAPIAQSCTERYQP